MATSYTPDGMRIRTRGSLGTTYGSRTDSSGANDTYEYPETTGKTERFVDVETPNFHKRIAKGEVIVNPMSLETEERHLQLWNISYEMFSDSDCSGPSTYWQSQERFVWVDREKGHIPIPIDTTRMKRLCGTDAMAGVQEPTFAGLVELAESRETMGMLKGSVDSLRKKAEKAKSRARKGKYYKRYRGRKVGDFINDMWLGYRYGWTPLVLSMQDLLEALGRLSVRKREVSRSQLKIQKQKTEIETYGAAPPTPVEHTVQTRTTSREVTVRCGVIYEQLFDNHFGSSWSDIPTAAWELLPYSFVVGWVLNLDNVIAAYTPKQGVEILGSWTTYNNVHNTVLIQDRSGSFTECPRMQTSAQIGTFTRSSRYKSRSPGVLVGLEREYLLNPEVGANRVRDALALLRNVLKSRI